MNPRARGDHHYRDLQRAMSAERRDVLRELIGRRRAMTLHEVRCLPVGRIEREHGRTSFAESRPLLAVPVQRRRGQALRIAHVAHRFAFQRTEDAAFVIGIDGQCEHHKQQCHAFHERSVSAARMNLG